MRTPSYLSKGKKFGGKRYEWIGHFPSKFYMEDAKERYRKQGYKYFRIYQKYELFGRKNKKK